MIKHLHHKIPKHMGGTDDPSNLIELTIEEHAEAHRLLYEEFRSEYDLIAWRTLSGQISVAEATKQAQKEAAKRRWTDEAKQQHSLSMRGSGNHMFGKTISKQHKAAISKANAIPKPGLSTLYKERYASGEMQPRCFYGKDNPKARKISVDGVIYDSIADCQRALGIKWPRNILYRLQSKKWPEWFYI